MELDLHYGVGWGGGGGRGGGGVPYGMYNKLTRMTTVLGLNDKFLTYPSDNRVLLKKILNICMLWKKEKVFHDFNWIKTYSSCTVFFMSRTLK